MTDRSSGHLADEDFVLDYYGELDAADRDRVRTHLARCADCQQVDRDVRATLRLVDVAPVPELPESFERELWARIEPHLQAERAAQPWTARLGALLTGAPVWWPRLAWGGGVAAAMVLAFFVGRAGRAGAPDAGPTRPASFHRITEDVCRERLLPARTRSRTAG